ncbi:hypothetical protein JW835_13355, partial [bacterium]|nr:hypothetical protein [bacterium]
GFLYPNPDPLYPFPHGNASIGHAPFFIQYLSIIFFYLLISFSRFWSGVFYFENGVRRER